MKDLIPPEKYKKLEEVIAYLLAISNEHEPTLIREKGFTAQMQELLGEDEYWKILRAAILAREAQIRERGENG